MPWSSSRYRRSDRWSTVLGPGKWQFDRFVAGRGRYLAGGDHNGVFASGDEDKADVLGAKSVVLLV